MSESENSDSVPSRNSGHTKSAWITAGGTVLAALILGSATYMKNNASPVTQAAAGQQIDGSVAIVEVDPIPQTVNHKVFDGGPRPFFDDFSGTDFSTVRVVVENSGSSVAEIVSATLLVDEIRRPPPDVGSSSSVLLHELISHDGHIIAPLTVPAVGDMIDIPINVAINTDAKREFTIWFRGTDPAAPEVMVIVGRLRLMTKLGAVASKKVTLELHRETQQMPAKSPHRLGE